MSKALNKRIVEAYDQIYRRGDEGLEYMDGHPGLNADLMEHFYNDTLEQLNKLELSMLANQLELVAADMQEDLAF
jgi:hypothetical protein